MTPPPGFAPHFRASPLTDPWEPLWSRRDEGGLVIGVELGERHCNSRGTVHGGLIAVLADNAMGLACALAPEGPAGVVTVNLSVDYLGSAKPGDWLEIAAKPVRVGRTLAFAEAKASVADRVIARATGVFSVPPAAR